MAQNSKQSRCAVVA